jgi:hypothetical protein
MDGETVTGWIKSGLRGARLAAVLALAIVAASAGVGRAADAVGASARYAVGSPGMLVAQGIARSTWGVDPCGGQIDISWGTDDPLINARSSWANPVGTYGAPQVNTQCRVVFNAAMAFSWEKFCTVLVHEYGHLSGHPHTVDGPDVMSPIYRAPLPACHAAPDPASGAASSGPPQSAGRPAGGGAASRRAKPHTGRARAKVRKRAATHARAARREARVCRHRGDEPRSAGRRSPPFHRVKFLDHGTRDAVGWKAIGAHG